MTFAELLAEFRARVQDDVATYFVSDTRATMFGNEAIREACFRANIIKDSTTSVTQISLVNATAEYALSATIYRILRARVGNNVLERLYQEKLDEESPGWWDLTGEPTGYLLDVSGRSIRMHPTPDASYTAKLTVYRYPAAESATTEIPTRYHMDLLHWMEHLFYLSRDPEIYDPNKSQLAEQRFAKAFGPRPNHNSHELMIQHAAPMCAGSTSLA